MSSFWPCRAPCGALRAHAQIVAEGATQENIVPAANVQRRDGHAGVRRLDGEVVPVRIVVGMGEPVIKIVRQAVLQMGERLERQGMEDGLQRVNRLDQLPPALVRDLLPGG